MSPIESARRLQSFSPPPRGRIEEGAPSSAQMTCFTLSSCVNLVIPKPQNAKSLVFQPSVAPSIVRPLLTVLSTIYFYHYPFFQTDKINEVGPDGSLPAKFVSGELAQPKMTPKQAFGVCRIASQLSRSRCGCLQFPHPNLPPSNGGRNQNALNRLPRRPVAIHFISFPASASRSPYPPPPPRRRGARPAGRRRSDGAGFPREANWRRRRTSLRSDPIP